MDATNRTTNCTVGTATSSVASDANGNTLTDGKRLNVWDSENRLVECDTPPDASGHFTGTTYTYGSDGLRRESMANTYQNLTARPRLTGLATTYTPVSSTKTNYVYDASMLVEEIVQHFDGSGTATDSPTTITYFQGPQGPLYRKASTEDEPHWYVYDGLGSVVGEVDPMGTVTATKLFDVYGATRGYTGTPTTRQGFVGGLGHETDDETGLVYMRARYYDSGTGRFVSEDPSEQGINWFMYCAANPVNFTDESGKTWQMPWTGKVDWFTAGTVMLGVVMVLYLGMFRAGKISKSLEVSMFVSVELSMFCFAIGSLGMDDPRSIMLAVGGLVAGLTGALMPMFEEAKWATRTEGGIAVAALLSMAIIESGFLASIGTDTGQGNPGG